MENEKINEPNIIKNKQAKEGSFRLIIIIMLASLLIASLWDKVPQIKNSVHFILDPSAGAALDWNLNIGMLIIVFVITTFSIVIDSVSSDIFINFFNIVISHIT